MRDRRAAVSGADSAARAHRYIPLHTVAHRWQAWIRRREPPTLAEGSVKKCLTAREAGLLLVLGYPRNMAQLLRPLADFGFRVVILAPRELSHTSRSKV